MKLKAKHWIYIILYFLCWVIVIYVFGKRLSEFSYNNRVAFMNRMTQQIVETGDTDVSSYYSDFKKSDIAVKVEVYRDLDKVPTWIGGEDRIYVWQLKDKNGKSLGYVRYVFESTTANNMLIFAELSAVIFFIPLIVVLIYIDKKVLKPFRDFSDYPEKLSKGLTSSGVPETKNRLFGKYVWGMNMLSEKIETDRKEINRLLYDRKNFISTLAHGIKTPVANIKLYSEAIETGLYRGGVPDENDYKVAQKISKNADDIARLVGDILNDPGALRDAYDINIQSFYLQEIKDRLLEDFANRCSSNNLPFEVNMSGNTIVTSDSSLIMKCLVQMMENAIKYGDGTGIKANLFRQDDVTFFSVVNNGITISEHEIPLVFNCYYRGANAAGKEGSGIGLYEARSIARSLGGDIMMKISDNSTEVVMYVPDV